jgi:hypothetical protein
VLIKLSKGRYTGTYGVCRFKQKFKDCDATSKATKLPIYSNIDWGPLSDFIIRETFVGERNADTTF